MGAGANGGAAGLLSGFGAGGVMLSGAPVVAAGPAGAVGAVGAPARPSVVAQGPLSPVWERALDRSVRTAP